MAIQIAWDPESAGVNPNDLKTLGIAAEGHYPSRRLCQSSKFDEDDSKQISSHYAERGGQWHISMWGLTLSHKVWCFEAT